MVEKKYIIASETGLHIKPASAFVKKVMQFKDVTISVRKDDQAVNANSVVALLGLELSKNSEITLQLEGDGEAACLLELEKVLKEENII